MLEGPEPEPKPPPPPKQLGENTLGGGFGRFGVLFCSRQIEHEIGFDERLARLVEENKLFVRVGVYVFILELRVKLGVDLGFELVLCGEHCREGEDRDF